MFSGKVNHRIAKRRHRLLVTVFSLLAIILAGCGGGAQQNTTPLLIRAGSPEFEKFQQLIKIDDLEADESPRPIGDIVMTLRANVRNFTGRTLNALEIHAAVVDLEGKPVKERNVMVIPSRQPELENNKTVKVQVLLEGISKNDTRANIKMEVTGFSLK
ncbi:MAG TPA: hypothetical protein VGC66_22485 [Pyrinomonadaceae bacterium]|jgi:hypothetical protein